MELGEKIRKLRLARGMTQKQLSDGIVTRNMLSQIESGKATPSVQTLREISKKLDEHIGYFLDSADNLSRFRVERINERIRTEYKNKNYEAAAALISGQSEADDELNLILADCLLKIGSAQLTHGRQTEAQETLKSVISATEKTVYPTAEILLKAKLLLSYIDGLDTAFDYIASEHFPHAKEVLGGDFTIYLFILSKIDKGGAVQANALLDAFGIDNPNMKIHISARVAICEKRFVDAILILKPLVTSPDGITDDLLYLIYGDLELCCKECQDFQNAYAYSAKRIELLTKKQI